MTRTRATSDSEVKPEMGTTGYTPQEAAKVLTDSGFPFSAKQVRRALRKGNLKAHQVSGRWYIPRTSLNSFAKSQGSKAKATSSTAKSSKSTSSRKRSTATHKNTIPNAKPPEPNPNLKPPVEATVQGTRMA